MPIVHLGTKYDKAHLHRVTVKLEAYIVEVS
jgi:hypothetical protein